MKVKGGSEAGLVVLADPGVLLPLGGVLYPPQPEQSGHLQGLLTQENYTHNYIPISLSVNIVFVWYAVYCNNTFKGSTNLEESVDEHRDHVGSDSWRT